MERAEEAKSLSVGETALKQTGEEWAWKSRQGKLQVMPALAIRPLLVAITMWLLLLLLVYSSDSCKPHLPSFPKVHPSEAGKGCGNKLPTVQLGGLELDPGTHVKSSWEEWCTLVILALGMGEGCRPWVPHAACQPGQP